MNPQSFWKKYEFTVNQTLQFKAGICRSAGETHSKRLVNQKSRQ